MRMLILLPLVVLLLGAAATSGAFLGMILAYWAPEVFPGLPQAPGVLSLYAAARLQDYGSTDAGTILILLAVFLASIFFFNWVLDALSGKQAEAD